jgi:arylsulfatase A-like enzyme
MENCRAIRTDSWKLVMRHPQGPHELYDVQRDAQERFNLYGQPSMEEIRGDLQSKLTAFFKKYADPQYDIWQGGRSKARRIPQSGS